MWGLPQLRPVDPLTGYGMEFIQKAEDFAASAAFPFVQTAGDTGTYYVPDARNSLRAEDATWGYNSGASRLISQWSSGAFKAQKYGFEEAVTEDDRRNWLAGGADLDARVSVQIAQKLMIAREVRAEAIIDASSSYGTTAVTGTGQWNASSTPAANPRLDVSKASTAIRQKIGRPANVLILPGGVWDVVTGSQVAGTAGAQILEAIKYTGDGARDQVTPALCARYWNLDLVQPAVAIQSDATKHETTSVSVGLPEAGTYIWDQKEAYVLYNDPSPGQRSLNFGITFGPTVYAADRYLEPKIEGDIIRGKQICTEKEVCTAAMNVLTTVIA